MRRTSLGIAIGLAMGLLAIVAAGGGHRSNPDGNCYEGGPGPLTPTICD